MKVRTKLMVALLAVSLVPLAGASIASYLMARSSLRRQVLNQLESVASIQENRLRTDIQQDLEGLALLQSRTLLRNSLQSYEQSPSAQIQATFNQILLDAKSNTESFKEIHVLTPEGTVVGSTDTSSLGSNRADNEFFIKGMSGNSYDLFFLRDGKLMHFLAGPLTLNGVTIGVIAVESSASDLEALTQDYSGLGRSGETVLASKDKEGNAVFITPLRFKRQAALKLVIAKGRRNVAIITALSGKTALLTDAQDYRGVSVLAATRYIREPGWGLVVKMDQSEAFSPANNLGISLMVVFASVALLVIAASLLVSRSITRPVTDLTETALAVSAGDLAKRSTLNSKDEIGQLSDAFNWMTEDLVEARADLKRKVEERTAELESANYELDGYAHTVSHDLKNPLTAINLAAHLLKDQLQEGATSEEVTDSLDILETNISKSFALIDSLLALAEAGQVPEEVSRVDVSEVVYGIVKEKQLQLAERGFKVEVGERLGEVIADPTHIYQIFSNLIGNSIKHHVGADPLIEVSFLGDDDDGAHRYKVRDNGKGIPAESMARIFVPFFKGGETGETGVGLATVDKIVTMYGGEISACNDDGACFEFTLRDFQPGGG